MTDDTAARDVIEPTDEDLKTADELFGFDGAGNRTRPPSREAVAQAIAEARAEATAKSEAEERIARDWEKVARRAKAERDTAERERDEARAIIEATAPGYRVSPTDATDRPTQFEESGP